MIYPERTRRRLRAGGLLIVILGLLSLGFGIAAPGLAPDLSPTKVPLGRSVALPATGPFGGRLALYGASTDQAPPNPKLLGCRLRTADGQTSPLRSDRDAAELDRLVVDDQALLPLLEIRGSSSDWTITCSGDAVIGVQPLYLITTSGQLALVPMAAFSFATLALVLGLAAMIAFKPMEP